MSVIEKQYVHRIISNIIEKYSRNEIYYTYKEIKHILGILLLYFQGMLRKRLIWINVFTGMHNIHFQFK